MEDYEAIKIDFCKRCRAEASMKTENRKKENAGSMESLELRTVRGRDREREREKHRKLCYKNNALIQCLYMCVCSMHTFIQVLTRIDRSTIVLQCSLRAPTLTPKYIHRGISFFASARHPGSLLRTGVSDRYQPTRFSA